MPNHHYKQRPHLSSGIRNVLKRAFASCTHRRSYPMFDAQCLCYHYLWHFVPNDRLLLFFILFFLLSCTAQCIHLCCSRSNWLKDCKVIAFYLHADYFSLDLRYITRISDANDCIPQWNRSTPAIVHCESIASNAMQHKTKTLRKMYCAFLHIIVFLLLLHVQHISTLRTHSIITIN